MPASLWCIQVRLVSTSLRLSPDGLDLIAKKLHPPGTCFVGIWHDLSWFIIIGTGHSALGIFHVLALPLAFGAHNACIWHGMTWFLHACAGLCAFRTYLVLERLPSLRPNTIGLWHVMLGISPVDLGPCKHWLHHAFTWLLAN